MAFRGAVAGWGDSRGAEWFLCDALFGFGVGDCFG